MSLHSVKALENFTVMASDGDVGAIDEVFFDDEKWAIRYLVVDTGDWLSKREVLISPISIRGIDWKKSRVHTALTRQQVQDSPGIDTDQPVSRQHEAELNRHYGYPYYWAGPYMWGDSVFPGVVEESMAGRERLHQEDERAEHEPGDPHLRSSREVIGYKIQATDDSVGHVEDFLFDEEDWSIQHMVVDPRSWWPGRHVLISPQRIEHVSWDEGAVAVGVSRDELEHSPRYDPRHPPPGASGRAEMRR